MARLQLLIIDDIFVVSQHMYSLAFVVMASQTLCGKVKGYRQGYLLNMWICYTSSLRQHESIDEPVLIMQAAVFSYTGRHGWFKCGVEHVDS